MLSEHISSLNFEREKITSSIKHSALPNLTTFFCLSSLSIKPGGRDSEFSSLFKRSHRKRPSSHCWGLLSNMRCLQLVLLPQVLGLSNSLGDNKEKYPTPVIFIIEGKMDTARKGLNKGEYFLTHETLGRDWKELGRHLYIYLSKDFLKLKYIYIIYKHTHPHTMIPI